MNSISLGGVSINGASIFTDRGDSFGVSQSVKRTLGGRLKVLVSPVVGGKPITLVGSEEQGWITKETVDLLLEMANSPGGVYELLVNGVSTTVMFRNHEQPSFQAFPLVYRNNQEGSDYHTFSMKLMTI